jgi:hypothetical protein
MLSLTQAKLPSFILPASIRLTRVKLIIFYCAIMSARKSKNKRGKNTKKTTSLRARAARARSIQTRERSTAIPLHGLSSFRRTFLSSVLVVAMAIIIIFLFNPSVLDRLPASIVELKQSLNIEQLFSLSDASVEHKIHLISAGTEDPNSQKLTEIFQTIFPNAEILREDYFTENPQKLMASLGVTEVPTVILERDPSNTEPLNPLIRDLFEEHGQYLLLNVSLVNQSGQLVLSDDTNYSNYPTVGQDTAPVQIFIFSGVRDQYTRANEINSMHKFMSLVEKGKVQLVFVDLPQTVEGEALSRMLACVYDQMPDEYMGLREQIIQQKTFSPEDAQMALEILGVDQNTCSDQALLGEAPEHLGITKLPTYFFSQRGDNSRFRMSGPQDWEVYEDIIGQLLGE